MASRLPMRKGRSRTKELGLGGRLGRRGSKIDRNSDLGSSCPVPVDLPIQRDPSEAPAACRACPLLCVVYQVTAGEIETRWAGTQTQTPDTDAPSTRTHQTSRRTRRVTRLYGPAQQLAASSVQVLERDRHGRRLRHAHDTHVVSPAGPAHVGSRPGRATPETETPHGMGVSLIFFRSVYLPLLFHSNCTRSL